MVPTVAEQTVIETPVVLAVPDESVTPFVSPCAPFGKPSGLVEVPLSVAYEPD